MLRGLQMRIKASHRVSPLRWRQKGSYMSEELTLYKLIVLYMLDKVSFPMTNSQLSDFILTQGYTDYFKFQQTIAELLETELIKGETIRNNTYYTITEQGRNTCQYFQGKISKAIKNDIHQFLRDNEYELREAVSVLADYDKSGSEYEVQLRVREQGSDLIKISLRVPTEGQANLMCRRFEEKNQSIYAYLMKQLLTDEEKKG